MKQLLFFILLIVAFSFAKGLKGQNRLIEGVTKYRLYIKFTADMQVGIEQGVVRSFNKNRALQIPPIDSLMPWATYKQVVTYNHEEKQRIRQGLTLTSSPKNQIKEKLSGLLEVINSQDISPLTLLALATTLETYPEIEYVELSPLSPPPPPSTPNYEGGQYYLNPTSDSTVGIDAHYAWSIGDSGQGIKIADIEWGWDYNHDDLKNQNIIIALPTNNHNYDWHGTAVLGEMYAENNGWGVTGGVYGADVLYCFSENPYGRTHALSQGYDSLERGDVFVFEMQEFGADGKSYVPADYSQSVWDLTKTLTDAGIIVVAAAGNGAQNLDSPDYTDYMNRGDNGAIIVGAGSAVSASRVSMSTYGERVNVCGVGDYALSTKGDDNNNKNEYGYFNGTSSSTPIVASAVVAIQSYAKNSLGIIVSPRDMRKLLIETGTPSGNNSTINWTKNTPIPNIKAAIEKLVNDSTSISPTLYQLTVKNGDGSGEYQVGDTITIMANTAPEGKVFLTWAGDTAFVDSTQNDTTILIMPKQNVLVSATYTTVSAQLLTTYRNNKNFRVTSVIPNQLEIIVPDHGEYQVELYTLQGKLLERQTIHFRTLSSTLQFEQRYHGVVILNLTSKQKSFSTKVKLP